MRFLISLFLSSADGEDKMFHRLQCKKARPLQDYIKSPDRPLSYTSAKRQLLASSWLNLKDGVPVHISASLAAGTVATTVCAPADVLKSRFQSAGAGKSQVRNAPTAKPPPLSSPASAANIFRALSITPCRR